MGFGNAQGGSKGAKMGTTPCNMRTSEPLGACWARLGSSKRPLGILGALWGVLGSSWEHFGEVLGAFGSILGSFERCLETMLDVGKHL